MAVGRYIKKAARKLKRGYQAHKAQKSSMRSGKAKEAGSFAQDMARTGKVGRGGGPTRDAVRRGRKAAKEHVESKRRSAKAAKTYRTVRNITLGGAAGGAYLTTRKKRR